MSEWISDYEPGCYIDSRDTSNSWCIGKVINLSKEGKIITVRYDGWSEKWDKTFSFLSNRIAPFRRKSELYTGQKGTAIRSWQFCIKELSETAEKLLSLPETAFGLTQLLRGHLFTLVDCLLVCEYKQVSDLEAAILFLTSVLDFLVSWLRSANELFACYYECLAFPELFLTNSNAAKVSAWPELLFTLKRLFGLDPRTAKSLNTWTYVPENFAHSENFKGKINSTSLYFLNYFASINGFAVILDLIRENP